mgnify:CR=1 FL=1
MQTFFTTPLQTRHSDQYPMTSYACAIESGLWQSSNSISKRNVQPENKTN